MQLLSNLDKMFGLGQKLACAFPSLIIVENPTLFSLILELCLPFFKLCGLAFSMGLPEAREAAQNCAFWRMHSEHSPMLQ